MAGDWIKMRADLHTHPKVVRIASALDADRLRVVGALHATWCLFDAHSIDGVLDGYSAKTLNDMITFPGFAEAMITVGWLEEIDTSLCMPRFSEHNGQSAKRRAQETDRKRNVRKASASDADKKRTREEKRREDKDPPLEPPQGGPKRSGFDPLSVDLPEWLSTELWLSWVEYRRHLKKPIKTQQGVTGTLNKLDEFRGMGYSPELVIQEAMANEWQGLYEPKNIKVGYGQSAGNTSESIADRQLREGREQYLREQQSSGFPGMAAVGNDGENLQHALDSEEWQQAFGSLGATDWVNDH